MCEFGKRSVVNPQGLSRHGGLLLNTGRLANEAHEAAVGAAVDHLDDPEDGDEAGNVLVSIAVLSVVGQCFDCNAAYSYRLCARVEAGEGAQSGQAAESVESEDRSRDDGGKVETAHETAAAGTDGTGVEVPGASQQDTIVASHEKEGYATESVDDGPAAAI